MRTPAPFVLAGLGLLLLPPFPEWRAPTPSWFMPAAPFQDGRTEQGSAAFGHSLHAREVFQTHGQILAGAKQIVHVRVDGYQPVDGVGQVYEFTVVRLEQFRGRVPATFRLRMPVQSRVMDPDGRPDEPGSEWVVLLDGRAPAGHYLFSSLTYGKIELMLRRGDGRLVLARPLPDLDTRGRLVHYSLDQFRNVLQRLRDGR